MKLSFLILEVALSNTPTEMSMEEAKNWKQPTYWEAMFQLRFQIDAQKRAIKSRSNPGQFNQFPIHQFESS